MYKLIISLHLIRPNPLDSYNLSMRLLMSLTIDTLKKNHTALTYSELYLLNQVVKAHDADHDEFEKHAKVLHQWLN